MPKPEYPVTPAIRVLREKGVAFKPHQYAYEEHGGTRLSSAALNVAEHQVVKTIVMQTDERKPLLVLMHGDREVSTKQLARVIGVKKVEPCDEATAQKHTGYVFGGTSPFGTRTGSPCTWRGRSSICPRFTSMAENADFLLKLLPLSCAPFLL